MEQQVSLTEAFFRSLQPVVQDDVTTTPGSRTSGVHSMLLYAIVIYIGRCLYEQFVADHIMSWLGVVDKRKKPEENAHLERIYREDTNEPSAADILRISREVEIGSHAVDLWFRRRRNWDRPSKVKKFKETSWRFGFYAAVFVYGLATIVRTPWFWDLRQCWLGYPNQTIYPSVNYYYMLEGGFYISLVFTLLKDIKRKDFKEQIIHHFCTIGLIFFSYTTGFVRIGSLIMAIHDVSDIFLELAKCALYANKRKLADHLFVVFAVTFLFTRLYILPCYIVHTVFVHCREILPPFTGWYVSVPLLIILQLLHVFWAWTILRMAVRMMSKGEVEKDDRSDVEEETADEDHKD